jgi:hypothetical protein
MPSRFPSISANSGAGYETSGKEGFDNVLEFRFDYSNLDNGAREVRRELSNIGYEIHRTFKQAGIPRTRSANKQFTISPKLSAGLDQSDAGIVRMFIPVLPDGKRISDALAPAMGQIGEEGKQTMKKYANRVDTGLMQGSIYYRTRRLAKSYVVRIGWTDLWYKYFGFQENGTKSIRPMRSVLRTFLEMQPRVVSFADRFIRSFRRTGNNPGGVNYR